MNDSAPPSQRDVAPPRELVASMQKALAVKNAGADSTATEVLDAALHLLCDVLLTGCETRAAALDLLTVDALITRALELAAADPETMRTFPERAMQSIAAIGDNASAKPK
jgi:hypothetical protein